MINGTEKAVLDQKKSEPQKFETFGNNSKTYKVGRSFLLEGSVIVYVNGGNNPLTENVDYTVNYYDGSVTFKKAKTKVDFIQIIYEFTNPIQDFIPALSRKDFVGLTYIYNPSQNVNINEFILKNASQQIYIFQITRKYLKTASN